MIPKVAVILFPGINCENEAVRAAKTAGMDAKIIRWNEDPSRLREFNGFIIPGGWAYEDRIRAGVIASKDKIMETIRKEADDGKPVLGICNGAQVLIETAMVPGFKKEVEMALAPNINPRVQGFLCRSVYLKVEVEKETAFNRFYKKGDVVPVHIAHAEGRFTTNDENLINKLVENDMVMFRYCDKEGSIDKDYPVNPNGSMHNIAALSNKQGNVMAIMPHPERSVFVRQLPNIKEKMGSVGDIDQMEAEAPARRIFKSMKSYIEDLE